MLVSDYFGYDHWRSPKAYSSCEHFKGADITEGTHVSSAYWCCPKPGGGGKADIPKIELHAGYTDGHVETYLPSEVVPMRVSMTADGSVPYPDGVGPGVFYLPEGALHLNSRRPANGRAEASNQAQKNQLKHTGKSLI